MFANTPKPPYYAVIFSSQRTDISEGYAEMNARMEELVRDQPGYLGMEHARSEIGITISYWKDLESIDGWRKNMEHQQAKKLGRQLWYEGYRLRICKVEKEVWFESS
jgi:heme-degrading monooxygenase HmoA